MNQLEGRKGGGWVGGVGDWVGGWVGVGVGCVWGGSP